MNGYTLATTAAVANGTASHAAPWQAKRPLPGEVAREQRQHEEGRVAGVEHIGLVVDDERLTEQRGQLDGDARCHSEAQDHEPLDAPRRVRIAWVIGCDDQLLPQPLGVLARELARHRVEAAHPLDRHKERFVVGQPGLNERRHLIAQVRFQFLDVGAVDGLAAAQERPPLRDLRLERLPALEGRHVREASIQMPRNVASTTRHCFCWTVRCARPCRVMR